MFSAFSLDTDVIPAVKDESAVEMNVGDVAEANETS